MKHTGKRLRRRLHKAFSDRPSPGSQPGVLTTSPSALPTTVRALCYGPDGFEEHNPLQLDMLDELQKRFPVVWVDVAGLADIPVIERIGKSFALHPLALEDAVHTHQRAKVEDYDKQHFIVVRMAPCKEEEQADQLSMFLGDGFVVSFQEHPGDDLDCVRDRIRRGKGRIRDLKADYLAYAILDAAVDAYFPLLEKYGEELEDLEDDVVLYPDPSVLTRVYEIRRRLLMLRRAVWPLREALTSLVRDLTPHISEDTRAHLRDVADHAYQIIDLMETYRELSSNLMDVYLSSISNRMNEVMKILTIITTIFIPLTFIVGVYGMNFNPDKSPWNMPELNAHYGYPICLAVMLFITVAQIIFFRRKGWIGSPEYKRALAEKKRDQS